MTYTRDANELAMEAARRERTDTPGEQPRRGHLQIWANVNPDQATPDYESANVLVQVNSAVITAVHPSGDVEIFHLPPGGYAIFEKNREGE